jgi:hypothetical protein
VTNDLLATVDFMADEVTKLFDEKVVALRDATKSRK